MADKEKILAALAQLDPLDDDQWTADGAPKVEVVSGLVGQAVKRQDIVNAAPDFSRYKAGQSSDQASESQPEAKESSGGDGGDQGGDTQTDPETASEESSQAKEDPDAEEGETKTEALETPSSEMNLGEFQSWLRTVPKDHLEEVEAGLKNQNDEVGAEIKKLQELQKRITRATSMTRNRIKDAFPNSPDAHAIRSFIESQNKARAERIGRRNEILKGIRPDELEPRAPIDAAMARKNKRGTGRPVRPLMK